ncbi:hypothetical protein L1277_001184 [Okibacterium sp. HSC-33S16]|nr:hypothetical protein [Okibacterium sp. HSC-33S16]
MSAPQRALAVLASGPRHATYGSSFRTKILRV